MRLDFKQIYTTDSRLLCCANNETCLVENSFETIFNVYGRKSKCTKKLRMYKSPMYIASVAEIRLITWFYFVRSRKVALNREQTIIGNFASDAHEYNFIFRFIFFKSCRIIIVKCLPKNFYMRY